MFRATERWDQIRTDHWAGPNETGKTKAEVWTGKIKVIGS